MSAILLCAVCLGLSSAPSPAPGVLLNPIFFDTCRRPCEYVGFSFDDSPEEMALMRADGANATGSGSMWVPTQDPTAPYGCGIGSLDSLTDTTSAGQSFTAVAPFTGVAFCTPIFNTATGGCTLSLYSSPPDKWGAERPAPLATAVLTGVKDNQWSWLTFGRPPAAAELPAGTYYLEESLPTGDAIGAWAVGSDTYPGGMAYISRKPLPGDDFEMMIRAANDQPLIALVPTHHAVRLGLGVFSRDAAAGLHFDYDVGNWNNPGFPYYPQWFIDKFPDFGMQDAAGHPILGGMFGKLYPAPSIDMPVIVDGTERYLRAVAEVGRGNPNLLFWCMGGEALYPTYGGFGGWTDYAPDAVAHYRAWLAVKYRDISHLNEAWGTHYASFADVTPPAPPVRDLPSLDWLRYRNVAMADRFVYHFSALKSVDPSHLAVTCNHGDLFVARWATELGEDQNLFAGVSDGWEMGQIVQDDDPDLYNLMWMRTAGTFGKPLNPVRLAYKKTNPKARGGGTSFDPAAARRYFYECVGTGAWHMGFCQWRGDLPDGEWGVKGTPGQAEIAKIFSEWHAMGPYFDDAWPIRERVGLYFAQPTWTMDGFAPLWTSLAREFTQRQIGYRILCDQQILDGDFAGCSVVVSAENTIMSAACRQALVDYAAQDKGRLILVGRNAVDDEDLHPSQGDPFAPVRSKVTALTADNRDLADRLERLLDTRHARFVAVAATSDKPYLQPYSEATCDGWNTPFDLAGHRSVGQTFVTTLDGLRGVAVSNPTFNKKYAGAPFTLEVLAGGPDGKLLGRKTFPPEEMGDNSRHEVPIDLPAPAGKYYVRLVTPEGMPPATLGVWGRAADSYPGGSLYVDDQPAAGDLTVWLNYLGPTPARAALESFTLSDGLNAIAILTNISGTTVRADLKAAPELLPSDAGRVHLTDLASGSDLGAMSRDAIRAQVAIPPHRSAIVFIAAEVDEATAKAAVAKLEASATGPQRAHLVRAREALAAGRFAKALACARLGEASIPCVLTATASGGKVLDLRAECPGTPTADLPRELEVRFVPLPGKMIRLARGGDGTYTASLPITDLGSRYDYAAKRYVPYWGGLEVLATGSAAGREVAASCVVDVPSSGG